VAIISSWRKISQLLPEEGVPKYDSLPPSNDALPGVKGTASQKAANTGFLEIDKEGPSCDDDDPDD